MYKKVKNTKIRNVCVTKNRRIKKKASNIHTGRKEGNVLFTVWSRTYSKGPVRQQWFFYIHHPTDKIAHTTVFVTPVMEHWLEREIAQWVHHEG